MSDFMAETSTQKTFARGRGNPKELKPWQALADNGQVTTKLRCWSDPLGCERYVAPAEMRWHPRLCNACAQALCLSYGMDTGDIDYLVILILQDLSLSRSAKAMGGSAAKLEALHQGRHTRPKDQLAVARKAEVDQKIRRVNQTYRQWFYDEAGVPAAKSRAETSGIGAIPL